ncbi:MAG: glycosyltransferase family 4 protein [Ferruginibacter sp.]
MNILIIGPAYPLRGGGLASFNERLARAFQQQNHKVTIYTFSLQYPSFLFPGSSQLSTEPAPRDLNIKVAINSVNPLNWIKVGRQIYKEKPDIIIVRYWIPFMGPCLGTILRIAKKNNHSKVVCIADNIIPHESRPGDKAFTKYFIKPVDAFITMSRQVLDDLKTFSTTKPARLVAHPLYDNFGEKISRSEARKHLGIDEHLPLLLFFGFIRKYKGLDILLDAMKLLKEQTEAQNIITPQLLIAGEYYDNAETYRQQIKEKNIADVLIERTGFIADSEIKFYLCATDVVVQPYRHATQSGVSPLAYHFEIPMIVTNVGGLPDMVPHNVAGLVTEPDAMSINKTIQEFFKKGQDFFLPGLLEEKKKYSWEIMVKQIIDAAEYKL